MNQALELRQQRAKVLADCKELVGKAASEKRALNAEENQKYDLMFAESTALAETIRKAEEINSIDYAIKEARGERQERTGQDPDQQSAAFNQWMRLGFGALNPEQRALMSPAEITPEMRALTTQTGSSGGVTVPQGFENRIVEAMKFWNGIEQAGAEVLTTDSGNDIPWPNANDTGNVAVIVGENAAAATNTDPVFSSVTLKAFNYTSNVLLIPNQLLQDNAVDLEAFVTRSFAQRFGRGFNAHCTTGTGTGQPQGVVTAAVLGKTGANGQTTSVVYADLQDLKFSVDKIYRTPNAKWMMNDQSLKVITKLVDGSGRPLLLDYEPGIKQGDPDVLLGYRVIINNDMAVMAASAKSIIYGDFTNFKIRRVRGMISMRLVERYAEAFQVGFISWLRQDGRMQNAGNDPVKYYANSAT